jgi:hypothetical protein
MLADGLFYGKTPRHKEEKPFAGGFDPPSVISAQIGWRNSAARHSARRCFVFV